MKPISIETQRALKFIPFLNYLVFVFFLYNCFVMKISGKVEWKALLCMTCISVPCLIVFDLLCFALPTAEYILQFLRQYFVCLIWAHGLIEFQRKW